MGDFWQTTSQLYSSLFEKPKMLEKLLIKPPFKYIFDIITETAKVIFLPFHPISLIIKLNYSPQDLETVSIPKKN